MAAGLRTKIDLSQLDARPVLRLVPPLPEVEPAKQAKARPRRAPKRRPRHRAETHAVACSQVIRRRRRVAGAVLVGLVMFLVVLGVGELANALAGATLPERTSVVWVEPGETLWDVAERSAPGYDTGVIVARIHELNEIPGNNVLAGQALQVPFAP
jgi:LysM domain